MRLIKFDQKKGVIKLTVDSIDDLWVLYNIISKGDIVYSKTFRRVRQSQEQSRTDKGERVPMYLGIKVEEVSFHGFSDRLRIKGKIISGPEDLCRIGAYHTLNIDLNQTLEIVKDSWPKIEIKRINEAIERSIRPKILVCAVDSGDATIAVLSDFQTKIYSRITENVPGKRISEKEYTTAFTKFFSGIYNSIVTAMKNFNVDYIIIAGPGFVKDHLYEYILNRDPNLKNKIIVDSASSGDVTAINEVIRRGASSKVISELEAVKESKLLEEVLARLGKGDQTVVYGIDEVEKAASIGAVATLLLTDEMLRESEQSKKQRLYKLIDLVENTRGEVKIISTSHSAGDILKGLSGIAAILRFKI